MKTTDNSREKTAIKMVQTLPVGEKPALSFTRIPPRVCISKIKDSLIEDIDSLEFNRTPFEQEQNYALPDYSSVKPKGRKTTRNIEIPLTDHQYHHYNAKALAQNTTLAEEIASYLYQRFPLDR